jgi:hypothetical protein
MLIETFPEIAGEVTQTLLTRGETALAGTIPSLAIVDRCRCGDSFCATIYTVPRPKGAWGPNHRNIHVDSSKGIVVLDVVDDRVVEVEILYRDDIRERLLKLLP